MGYRDDNSNNNNIFWKCSLNGSILFLSLGIPKFWILSITEYFERNTNITGL
jgi:hypothetical protein